MPPTDDTFFWWVRSHSERKWSQLGDDASWLDAGVLGIVPSRSTTWTGGLSDGEIAACEKRYGLRFPSAYRSMLRELGGTTPMRFVGYRDGERRTVSPEPGWLDPRRDDALIRARLDALPALLWPEDADEPGSSCEWAATWGDDPGAREPRLAAIRRWLTRASPAWPMFAHRYMIMDEATDTAVVLSIIDRSDIVVYGASVEDYLLRELELDEQWRPPYERGHERTIDDFALWPELLE
jgi:hypothetical protein